MIKPACSVSFLLSINIFLWQNVLYFPNDLRINTSLAFSESVCSLHQSSFETGVFWGTLPTAEWLFLTDDLGQYNGPTFNGQAVLQDLGLTDP